MNLSKTALRELSAKYRAVLIKCALMNMMIFAGALMPHTANAYLNFDPNTGTITVDQNSALENSVENIKTITFGDGNILDGQGNTLSGFDGENLTLSTSGTTSGGSLNDITLKASEIAGATTDAAPVEITGNVVFDAATVSNIHLKGGDDSASLTLKGTMKGGSLASQFTVTGTLDNVDLTSFDGIAKDTAFLNYDTFNFNQMNLAGKTEIHADKISGVYHLPNPLSHNLFESGTTLVLRNKNDSDKGTWDVGGQGISPLVKLRGGNIYGNLKNGKLLINSGDSIFEGALNNFVVEIWRDYVWNGNIRLDPSSSDVTLSLGNDHPSSTPNQITFTMTADVNNISEVSIHDTTVNGNGKTITTPKLTVENNGYFNNVKIKSGENLTVTGGGALNLTNSSLSAGNSITATDISVIGTLDVDLYAAAGDQRFSADNITGANGAKVTFRTSGKSSDGIVYFNKKTGNWIEIKDVSLNFSGTNATFMNDVYFTNAKISTTQRDTAFEFQGFRPAVFRGENTIVADNIKTNVGRAFVDKNASLMLKNIDGTGNGSLTGGLELYGHFTGDVKDGKLVLNAGSDWSFSGKLNADSVTAYFTDGDTLDMANLKLTAGSSIEQLTLIRNKSQLTPRMIVNSDFSVNELWLVNNVSSAETAARIAGTGTLKTNKIYPYDNKNAKLTVYFDGINIAALNNDLDFTGVYLGKTVFTNNAISAPNHIGITADADFNGNSSLTAQTISVRKLTLNGTLNVNGKLEAGGGITGGTLTMNGRLVAKNITDSTLNIVLPSVADPISEGAILLGSANNVNLNLDLKNVKSKNAQQYFVVDELHYGEYTISGSYGKWAFSADNSFTLEDWKADKDKYLLSNVWGNSKGKLWILKVAGGAESAIDELRMAGIYVSPTEENASKILDLTGNNPFADRLTDLLDSGDAGLQKQALREIVPTDAAASAFKSAKSAANAVMNSVSGRLGGGSDVSGRSGGDLVAGKASVWVQGMLNHAKMTSGDGFTSGTTGFAAGVEHNVTDEIKAGFGYAFASSDIKTDRSKTDADTHTGFVYGEYAPDALYVNAMLSFGRSDYNDTTRAAGMKSSYRADTYGARVAAGYALGLLMPEAALRFTAVHQKAYTDALGARVAAKNLNTATAVVGTKASKTFTAGKHAITPEVKLALTYDFARPKEDRTVTLPDGSSYVAAGEHLKRLGVEVGAKAAVRLTNEVELSVSYDGAFKEHYQDHTGMLNLKLMFQ